ncbi:O(6)-methylguanine-induced apoptosis 2 [Quaeritorhiza haematococci]|nr:O(6)-methylguanine-induced apoptosis 2 [Quaeritorhiza haematococci]
MDYHPGGDVVDVAAATAKARIEDDRPKRLIKSRKGKKTIKIFIRPPTIPSRYQTIRIDDAEFGEEAYPNDPEGRSRKVKPFNSTSRRFGRTPNELPGPGYYRKEDTRGFCPVEQTSLSRNGYGVGFASKSRRFRKPPTDAEALKVGPGSYNVATPPAASCSTTPTTTANFRPPIAMTSALAPRLNLGASTMAGISTGGWTASNVLSNPYLLLHNQKPHTAHTPAPSTRATFKTSQLTTAQRADSLDSAPAAILDDIPRHSASTSSSYSSLSSSSSSSMSALPSPLNAPPHMGVVAAAEGFVTPGPGYYDGTGQMVKMMKSHVEENGATFVFKSRTRRSWLDGIGGEAGRVMRKGAGVGFEDEEKEKSKNDETPRDPSVKHPAGAVSAFKATPRPDIIHKSQ